MTSATLSWSSVGTSYGYEVDASSTQFTGGVIFSTFTSNNAVTSLTLTGLNPDTTYSFNIGSLWNGTTTYSGTQPSTSTWANLINPSVANVSSATISVNWPAFASGSSTNTAQGYELDVSTSTEFHYLCLSNTSVVAQSTLTISGSDCRFHLLLSRAGAANWDSYVDFV